MPESKARKRDTRQPETAKVAEPIGVVYKSIMFGLLILGFLWIITFYITEGAFPIEPIQYWNIAIGFGLALIGFLMMTRWR
ncbi:cell division protein CrgA [Haematomicrobium sanguinis]|uniref:cell division protein CrgA n=1 Tax=Haematomicrobium sanguinis TaxID=479106 RepID=UPI00047EF68A|nr:cell division protein CrgA [Haematomicrobium sanguinis]